MKSLNIAAYRYLLSSEYPRLRVVRLDRVEPMHQDLRRRVHDAAAGKASRIGQLRRGGRGAEKLRQRSMRKRPQLSADFVKRKKIERIRLLRLEEVTNE